MYGARNLGPCSQTGLTAPLKYRPTSATCACLSVQRTTDSRQVPLPYGPAYRAPCSQISVSRGCMMRLLSEDQVARNWKSAAFVQAKTRIHLINVGRSISILSFSTNIES